MKYIVTKYEVWAQPVEVDADSRDEAIHAVSHEQGRPIEELFEYSHDLSENDWKVEEA